MPAMMRHLIVLISVFTFATFNTGCSMFGGSDSESTEEAADTAEASEEAADGDEFAEEATSEEGDAKEETADAAESTDSSDESLEGGETAEASGTDDGADDSELNEDEEIVADLGDEDAAGDSDVSAESATDSLADSSAAAPETATDSLAPADSSIPEPAAPVGGDTASMGDSSFGGGVAEAPAAPVTTLQKIAQTPWTQSGILLNAVYVARPGDTLESVSTKVLGKEDVAALKKGNPRYTGGRGVKVGDKIYYNSPQRAADNTKIVTFYEDMGLNPEVYVSQPGDNIREVSKRLLGHNDSWKEVWSTNLDVESKGEIPEGTSLKYWSASEAAAPAPAQPVADAGTPPPPADMPPPPQDTAMNNQPPPDANMPPPPPPQDMGNNDIPPPPAAGTMDTPPPPPPPSQASNDVATGGEENPDETMALAGGAVLIFAALLLFIMIRKRRARRSLDFATSTQTQID